MGGVSGCPRVSILLPVFDAAATLDACLRSIARQSERRWECVVNDDGSRDGSLARARTASGDERAALWRQMVGIYPPYTDYQERTEREIPVVVLEPIGD